MYTLPILVLCIEIHLPYRENDLVFGKYFSHSVAYWFTNFCLVVCINYFLFVTIFVDILQSRSLIEYLFDIPNFHKHPAEIMMNSDDITMSLYEITMS